MSTTELNELELEINNLIQTVEHLKTKNVSLKHQLERARGECTRLKEQNVKAVVKVKRIINQLKDEFA